MRGRGGEKGGCIPLYTKLCYIQKHMGVVGPVLGALDSLISR